MAAALSLKGLRVLLIDCDPQGNATTGIGLDKSRLPLSLFEVLCDAAERSDGESQIAEAIVHVPHGFDAVGASLDLAGAESVLLQVVGKELLLRDAIAPVRGRYDWIILDAPPSLGLLTINVLAASDAILVPMQSEFFALEGLGQLMRSVDLVRKRVNPGLRIAKVLFTMFDPRNRLAHQVAQEVQDYFGDKVSQVSIPRNIRLSEAPSHGHAAVTLFQASKGAAAYRDFVEEVLVSHA